MRFFFTYLSPIISSAFPKSLVMDSSGIFYFLLPFRRPGNPKIRERWPGLGTLSGRNKFPRGTGARHPVLTPEFSSLKILLKKQSLSGKTSLVYPAGTARSFHSILVEYQLACFFSPRVRWNPAKPDDFSLPIVKTPEEPRWILKDSPAGSHGTKSREDALLDFERGVCRILTMVRPIYR